MGFWDALSYFADEVQRNNKEAKIDAGNMSTEELCYKINTVNAIFNPLIWTNCSEELKHRAERMRDYELKEYYYEYVEEEAQDAADVFKDELLSRGYRFE